MYLGNEKLDVSDDGFIQWLKYLRNACAAFLLQKINYSMNSGCNQKNCFVNEYFSGQAIVTTKPASWNIDRREVFIVIVIVNICNGIQVNCISRARIYRWYMNILKKNKRIKFVQTNLTHTQKHVHTHTKYNLCMLYLCIQFATRGDVRRLNPCSQYETKISALALCGRQSHEDCSLR